jgi:ankyrin repeat protein
MTRPMLFASLLLLTASPAIAQQQSESYKFLQAVREAKGNEVIAMLDKPGSQIVNTRDVNSGEGAIHIVIKRGDQPYLLYLLQKGADANLRDHAGNTPLMLAVEAGQVGMIPLLVAAKANPNLGNGGGETPLIRAVQRRDIAAVRALLAVDADPDQTDNVAGMSARGYAAQDTRNTAIAKIIGDTPKKTRKAVSGPRL